MLSGLAWRVCKFITGDGSYRGAGLRGAERYRAALAVEALEERTVLTPGAPADLVVTYFALDEWHSTDDPWLQATVTITNTGHKSKGFDLTFYANTTGGEYSPGDVLLKEARSSGLKPGESVTIERKIRDPVYVDNPFDNGYYIGVHADAQQAIFENNDHDNHLTIWMSEANHLANDKAAMYAVLAGFAGLGLGGVAYQHLDHFLDGNGSDKDWAAGSLASVLVTLSPEFAKSAKAANRFLEAELKQAVKNGAAVPSNLDVPEEVVGKPKLDSDLDLFFGIAGTQGSSGEYTNISVTPLAQFGSKTLYSYEATLQVTYHDVYEFDTDDAHKTLGHYARHLQMTGEAHAFNVSVTTMPVVVQGFFKA